MNDYDTFLLTNLSVACALGRTNDEVYRNLKAKKSGLVPLEGEIPGRTVWFGKVPGELPAIDDPEFDTRTNRLLLHAVNNLRAKLDELVKTYGADRVGIVLGASNTGVHEAQAAYDAWLDAGARPEAFRFAHLELGSPAEYLKRLLGVTGPAYTVSTACSSSAKAFASARRLIEANAIDAAVVGGVDGLCRFALNGFHALGALAREKCRPLAEDRDGINLGEGVALFTMEGINSRTEIWDEPTVSLLGVGETSDAHHATAPDPEGTGACEAMRRALFPYGPEMVGYVNLHGTGTPANDAMEMKALRSLFEDMDFLPRHESTKALTGHCLGAAGAVEAALCWLYLMHGDATGVALSNSFAFGGSNACVALMFEEVEEGRVWKL